MWSKGADVVIVGYGGAGAAAAITAHDAGAKVIVLEKNDEGGGNTQHSGGTIREFLDVDKAATYIEGISFDTVERDIIKVFVEECIKNPEWMKELGADVERTESRRFPPAVPGVPPQTQDRPRCSPKRVPGMSTSDPPEAGICVPVRTSA